MLTRDHNRHKDDNCEIVPATFRHALDERVLLAILIGLSDRDSGVAQRVSSLVFVDWSTTFGNESSGSDSSVWEYSLSRGVGFGGVWRSWLWLAFRAGMQPSWGHVLFIGTPALRRIRRAAND